MMQEPGDEQEFLEDEPALSKREVAARKAAKDFLRPFLLLEWQVIHMPKHVIQDGWDFRIGGTAEDSEGKTRFYDMDKIIITRIGRRSHYVYICDIGDLIYEIRKALEPARCAYCGAKLDNRPRGRERLYCDNKGKCKQAHHRQKQREERRAAILQEHEELSEIWRERQITGRLLALLQEILLEQGAKAAYLATAAIVQYAEVQIEQDKERAKASRRAKRANTAKSASTEKKT